MSLAKTLFKIPWRDILDNAPLIFEAAKKAYKTMNKNPVPSRELPGERSETVHSLTDLQEMVEELKRNEVRQAKLTSDLAEQVKALSEGLNAVSFRANMFLVISVGAVALSLFLLIKIFFFS